LRDKRRKRRAKGKLAVYNLGMKTIAPAIPSRRLELSWEPELRLPLPCVYGPLDYKELRAQFEQIDRLLSAGGVEARFVRMADEARTHRDEATRKLYARTSALALRCNVARKLLGISFRHFVTQIAQSHLLQWFLGIQEVDRIKCPAKSTVERFDKWVSAEVMAEINTALFAAACGDQTRPDALGLGEPIDADEVFFDATCLKADLHMPVDWVLLRDVARTLMKAVTRIRRQGLKQRMPEEPSGFLRRMNHLCMAMSSVRRKTDSKKARKKILRQMKTLLKMIEQHARAHRELLATDAASTEWSAREVARLLGQLDEVLAKVPASIKQAHERIIGERVVPNDEKILSLYDEDLVVLVRGKAGAEVEFGNKLWLGETREGVIVDYQLVKGAPVDSKLVMSAVKRLKKAGVKLETAWGDRGLASAKNTRELKAEGVADGLCPRDPKVLHKKLIEDPAFADGLKRRGGTEARIAILKNVFLAERCRAKGFEHRELAVGWAVLAHNLWVFARREIAAERNKKQKAA
jgi:hypothetical protein